MVAKAKPVVFEGEVMPPQQVEAAKEAVAANGDPLAMPEAVGAYEWVELGIRGLVAEARGDMATYPSDTCTHIAAGFAHGIIGGVGPLAAYNAAVPVDELMTYDVRWQVGEDQTGPDDFIDALRTVHLMPQVLLSSIPIDFGCAARKMQGGPVLFVTVCKRHLNTRARKKAA